MRKADIEFASAAKGVPMQDNNVLSWFIKPAHESRYQIVSGGAGVIGLPVTKARHKGAEGESG
jgi:hypothetical protein